MKPLESLYMMVRVREILYIDCSATLVIQKSFLTLKDYLGKDWLRAIFYMRCMIIKKGV